MSDSKLTFVSAGAGSGKTHRLTELLRDRLSSGLVRPASVIATTFTRKAAQELRERARSHLLANGSLALANALEESLISTVNGISQALLQRFCFEAGLSPELRVLEESDAAVLLGTCIEEALDGPTLARFLELSGRLGIDDWKEDLSALMSQARANAIQPSMFEAFAKRNVSDLLVLFGKPSKRDRDAELSEAIDHILPELRKAAASSKIKKTAEYLEQLEEFRRKLESSSYQWSDWPKLASGSPEAKLADLVSDIREKAAGYLTHSRLQADLRDYITLSFSVANAVLSLYEHRKREQGALDFTDQEVELLKALDNPSIVQALGDDLDLLLVDEFQDTSPVQLALFMRLTALAKETYWVGDIKQAIYGFRGSDSRLMDAVIDALPRLGGRTDPLDKSWRSRPSLVKLVNQIFVPAFEPIPKARVALKAQRAELSNETAFELWDLPGRNLDLRLAALAGQIRALLESGRNVVDKATNQLRPLRAGDIAILCRSRTRVAAVLDQLLAARIPFATTATGLLGRPECILALACLRRLNDIEDTIATAEILSLGDCEEPEVWLADRLAYLQRGERPQNWREVGDQAHPVLSRIADFRTELPMLSPREAMERVVSGCDLAPRVLRWCRSEVEARQRLANLDYLMTLAEAYEDGCRSAGKPGSISGLILWLDDLVRTENDPQPALAADAVHVLTHHGAKGLEWPAVILLDLDSRLRDRFWGITAESDGPVDVSAPLANRFIRFRPWPFGQTTKVPLRDLAATSPAGLTARKAALDEERRLLYVSMTRARDLLVLGLQRLAWNDEQWLSVTGAPWLLESTTPGSPALAPKLNIPSMVRQAAALETSHSEDDLREGTRWFAPGERTGPHERLNRSPSSAEPFAVRTVEKTRIGDGVPIASGFDRDIVGIAVHAVIAAGMGVDGPLSEDETLHLLRRHGVAGSVDPARLVSFVSSLRTWLRDSWPEGHMHAELGVESREESGHVVRGRIDLLIELPDGRVILDHKSGLGFDDLSADVAAAYAGQLRMYEQALHRVAPKATTTNYLVLPVTGSVVRLAS